jgi:hypothetical protein
MSGNINPGSVSPAGIIHYAARVPGPTACGASGVPCPAAVEWRYVTCPRCQSRAPVEVIRANLWCLCNVCAEDGQHEAECAVHAEPPAACDCGRR